MIYLDHHAATPTDPRVLQVMHAARERSWSNPSSIHGAGRASRALLERAREQVAAAIGAQAADVVFTSGGTEACHLGFWGALGHRPMAAGRAVHVVASRVEHPAIAEPVHAAEAQAARIGWLEVPDGLPPTADELEQSFSPDTQLVAVQWVNHETGTLLPVAAYAERCRRAQVPCLVDATQALGKVAVDVTELGADAVAFAAHKLGGPAGAGALWIRRGLAIHPQTLGGAQERGRRAGTPDVAALAGFGAACELVRERLAAQGRIAGLRDRLEQTLLELGGVRNADAGPRVATVTSTSFRGWRGEALVAALDIEGVACSSGAACSSGKSEPSPVLLAMHPNESWRASSALRLSFGVESSGTDVDFASAVLRKVLARPAA